MYATIYYFDAATDGSMVKTEVDSEFELDRVIDMVGEDNVFDIR